jgi:uncharacterized protein YjiS (DUF1127 family)
MGQQVQALHCPHPGHGSIGHKVASLTRHVWTRYWTRRAARATAAMLHTLDDRALKDIGLDRSEIESVVYGERSGRRSRCRQNDLVAGAHVRERRLRMGT